MLSVSKAIKAGQGEYYLSLSATDDYYLDGREPKGYWLGQGAEVLGLGGEVEPGQFRNLLKGFSPDGERKLVRNADSERRAGWDLTWSVPKSVSVAWSQADLKVRTRLEACVRKAVEAGVRYLEEVAAVTRRGEDGWRREQARIVFACFQHSTSRAQDPQLHVHTILHNIAIRLDGSSGTLEPKEMYRHQMAAGALFRAELAALLERELGLRSVRVGRAFEIFGVDPGLMKAFSARRAQVLEALERLGLSGGKAAEVAALDTRTQKESVSREELFDRWRQTGLDHRWSTRELSHLLRAPPPVRDPDKEMAAAATAAIARLTESRSHFSVRDLTQAIAQEGQGRNLGASEVAQIRAGLLRSQELVRLGPHGGEDHWTTQEVLNLEKKLLADCETLHHFSFPTAPLPSAPPPQDGLELSGEQWTALKHVCEPGGGIRVVSGMAGTGKSTLFARVREVWEAQGLTVLGACLSGKAARGLEDSSGIPSQTLHQTVRQLQRGALELNPKTIVLIDEAAMVGTRQLGAVARHCVKRGAGLVLAGDARQLQAIELGGGFAELSRRYGAAHLCQVRRQREEWAREAVKEFAAGETRDALTAYTRRGLVSVADEGRWGAMERLIADWAREEPAQDRDTAILGSTNADVSALNRMAQEVRRTGGHLGKRGGAVGKEEFFHGDRVLFTRNSMALGVMNGDRGTVGAGVGLTVRLDSGRLVQVDTERYPHLRLGYALTTHKSQGMTVERAFILVCGQVDREMAYVQASRARGQTRWYVGDDMEQVTRAMEKSHQKRMASSFGFWAAPGPELTLNLER